LLTVHASEEQVPVVSTVNGTQTPSQLLLPQVTGCFLARYPLVIIDILAFANWIDGIFDAFSRRRIASLAVAKRL